MIKFNKYNVTNGTVKARVWYSKWCKDGRFCIDITEKDYGRNIHQIFENVQNDTDSSTDYFCSSTVRIFEGDALYEAALARAV